MLTTAKTLLSIAVTLIILCGLVFVLADITLPTAQDIRAAQAPPTLEEQQIAKERGELILARLKADKAEEVLREGRAKQKIDGIPNAALLSGAWGWGSWFCAMSFLLVICVGVAGGIVKIFWIHGEIVASNIGQKIVPDAYKLQTAMINLRRDEIKALGMPMKGLPEAINIEGGPTTFNAPNALDCIEEGLISKERKDFFLGTGTQTGENEFLDIVESADCPKIAGRQKTGKSNTLTNLAGQSLLKGWHNIWIDLHNPAKKSFVVRSGKLATLPQVKIFSNRHEAAEALQFIDSLIDERLTGKQDSFFPVLIIVDEILNLMNMLRRDKVDASETFRRVLQEGGQNLIFMAAAAHTWHSKDVGSTGFRDSFPFSIAHNMEPLQAQTFGIDSTEGKNACRALGRGQTIIMDKGGDIMPVSVPHWTTEAIDKAYSMIEPQAWPVLADVQQPEEEIKEIHYGLRRIK